MEYGGGTKKKTSLGTTRDAFAMRFSVNQGFHFGSAAMTSLVFYSVRTKVVPVFSHPQILKESSDVYTARTGSVRRLLQSLSCRTLRVTSDRFACSNRVDQCLRPAC